jgi:hypothetical protein
MMSDVLRILFFETWWSWERTPKEAYTWVDVACRGFNFVEAAAWFLFAILVFRRWCRYRQSKRELGYAVAFILFGLSDLIEAWMLTSWLLWWKGINLVTLFLMRRTIMRRYYPRAKVY